MNLKIIFAGTPDFALPTLQALIDSPHEIVAVLTQMDRHSGRGQHVHMSPVKQLAVKNNIHVLQPPSLKDDEIKKTLRELNADVMIVVAYGLILPKDVLSIPRFGCINVHASILPRWRGAAPIHHAILNGDEKTGVSIMQMDVGLDTGDVLAIEEMTIPKDAITPNLYDDLSRRGAKLLLQVLSDLSTGKLKPTKQDNALATHAHKIEKKDAQIQWKQSAVSIERMIRAYHTWPVAYTQVQGEMLRVWKAVAIDQPSSSLPGTIIAENKDSIDVATGDGMLRILEVQLPGSRAMSMQDVLNSKKSWFEVGTLLC